MLGIIFIPPIISLICLITVILYDVFTVHIDKGRPPDDPNNIRKF